MNFCIADDHRETPKALPVGDSTQPTVNQDRKDDVRENLVDTDSYGLEDCSAQEYEIMKVRERSDRVNFFRGLFIKFRKLYD